MSEMVEREAANDNVDCRITHGSGNVFVDLGFDKEAAERAVAALSEFHAKGGRSLADIKAELLSTPSPLS